MSFQPSVLTDFGTNALKTGTNTSSLLSSFKTNVKFSFSYLAKETVLLNYGVGSLPNQSWGYRCLPAPHSLLFVYSPLPPPL